MIFTNVKILNSIDTCFGLRVCWSSLNDSVKLKFSNKEQAINYAKKNNIDYYVVEPQKSKVIIKSYSDNFLKKIKW